jgi:hypothetical protein
MEHREYKVAALPIQEKEFGDNLTHQGHTGV